MAKEVNLPNGQIASFPDDMEWDDIKAVVQKKFPPTQNNSSNQDTVSTAFGNLKKTNISDLLNPDVVKSAVNEAVGSESGINAIKSIPKGLEAIRPTPVRESLMRTLSKGAETAEEASQNIVKDIRDKYTNFKDEAISHLDKPVKEVGENKIYNKVDPLISTSLNKIDPLIEQVNDLNVGKIANDFKNNPTYNNANDLQKELGVMIGDLEKTPLKTNEIRKQMGHIKEARDLLKSHITEYLNDYDKANKTNLAESFEKGQQLWRDNVIPYQSSKKLRQITREGRTVIDNPHTIFKSPYDIVDSITGETKIGPVNKILNDLPQETKDQILFSKIGANTHADSSKRLIKAIKVAKNQGFSKVVSPEIESLADKLRKTERNKKLGLYGLGAVGLAGAGGGSKLADILKGSI